MAIEPVFPKVYLFKRIVAAKIFIDKQFAGKIDLDNIADEAYFSKFHFIRLFKSIYHQTPHQYLSFVRIERAKVLLQSEMPVAHVCYGVGFDSVSTFTGFFKRTTGQTPAVYRQGYNQKKAAMAAQPLRFIPNCFAEKNGWKKVG